MDANTAKTTTTTHDALDLDLDILGQSPLLRIYTQISLCFPVRDPSAHDAIVNALQKGLERLSDAFPWVAGQVVHTPGPEGNSGLFKIKALDKTPRLVVKDLRDDAYAPTMDRLRKAEFPMSMFNEDVITPRRTIPGGPNYDPSEPEPVLLLQVNWIEGGLILTVNGQHACMDMTGQGEVIRLLSKACRNEPFTDEELAAQSLARDTVVPFLDDSYEPGDELVEQMVPPPPPHPPTPLESTSPPPRALWVYFSFDPKSLAQLKADVEKSRDASTPFVSTDDALTALIWQSTTRARLPRLQPTDNIKLSRAVDARSCVGAPKGYPGLLQTMTYHNETSQQLMDMPLGVIASKLRSELDPAKLRFRVQALATAVKRLSDKAGFSITALSKPETDVLLSSWSKVNCWDLDFNFGLGKPESVRRPMFTPFESLMYLMPKAPDGEISLGISLREEDMERLKADQEFLKYGRYIG
ncbi:trichothecene 3-O-acetyltransferase [Thelonectria olida]|uniref:Trichothecene 3-O-acetyltransferase n=1 Tax=Thelonectria olida TaxID=1576542 RepID=A0A9P8W3S1_9HYPO|nr:trichothecene 3-O-acetyltransferase [Thelonectria olida]